MPKKEKPEAIAAMEAPDQPYSTCVRIGDHFHFAGVIAVNAEGKPDGSFHEQARKVMARVVELLTACGLTPEDVFNAEVLLAPDMSNYGFFNARWMDVFGGVKVRPVRIVSPAPELAFGCSVEIKFDAVRQSD